MIKKSLISLSLAGLALICLASGLLSYWQLDRVPYGFHVDEYAGAMVIGCLSTEGVDAHNVRYPLFSSLNYGTPKPPTYIYPGIVWSRIFGYSVASLRAFSVTVHLLGIAGLWLLARLLFGWRYALLTATVGCLSPWTWAISRVAFESLFAATFLIWGLYFFFRSSKLWGMVLSGLFFAAALYSYPPFRLQTPLMLLSLLVYSCCKKNKEHKPWTVFFLAFLVPLVPLVQKTLSGEIQQRFNSISILSKGYLASIHSAGGWKEIIGIFINNYLLHFSPDFLFLKGDPSYVHSTRHFGLLSWLDMLAVGLVLVWILLLPVKLYRSYNPLVLEKSFVLFLAANVLIGVLPAALTNSELPNSLRITGSWAFVCLLSGFCLWQACERWWILWPAAFILSLSFAVSFFHVYFKVFPQEGRGMFSYWTLEQANRLKTDEDWIKFVALYRYQDLNARYFLMHYRGLSCTESRQVWEGMNKMLSQRGIN